MLDEQVELQNKEITLPYKFSPRAYQLEAMKALDSGKKRIVLAWARGLGKDLMAMNYLIKKAMEKPGVYLHCFPSYSQAKRAIWKSVHDTHEGEGISYLDHIPPEIIRNKNGSEMMITLINGSIYCVMGLDGKNAMRARGMNPTFVILSEFAFMDQESWRTLEPRVKQNNGTAIFISCVSPKTIVLTENGPQYIDTVSDCRELYSSLNKKVWGLGGFHNAQDFYYGGLQKTLKITLNSGYSIECTPIHPIWNGKEWIKSQDLKVGDLIPIQYGQEVWGKGVDFTAFTHNNHGLIKFKIDEKCLSDDFFYLLGLINGDGYFSDTYVIIANIEPSVICFLNSYGFKSERGGTHHRLGSKELCSLLSYLGFKKGAQNKEFPKKLLSGTRSQIKSFLQGMFDADGTSNSNPKKYGNVGFTSTCLDLIKNIQIILLNFGIASGYRKVVVQPTKKVKTTSICYALEICGYFAEKFYQEIGFRIKRKQQNQCYVPDSRKEESGNIYPIDTNRLSDYCLPKNIISNPNKISRRLIQWLNKRKPHPYLEELLSEKFFYNPIKSIECSENEVFDFVIPETHSFFSNGFISHNTPNGQNHFYDLYNYAKKDTKNYYASLITVEDAGTLQPDDIEQLRREGVPEDFIQQEYFCSFKRGAEGSYYGKQIQKARDEERICRLPIIPDLPVHSSWDIGVGDATAIWLFQVLKSGNINFIHYYENNGEGLEHYIKYLKSFKEKRDIEYGTHFVPHDMKNREFTSGVDRLQTAKDFGFDMVVVPKKGIEEGIQAVRSILSLCYFDQDQCRHGLKCLDFYRKKWNDMLKCYYDEPLHDKWSNGADSFRYAAIGIKAIGFDLGSADEDIKAINAYWGY